VDKASILYGHTVKNGSLAFLVKLYLLKLDQECSGGQSEGFGVGFALIEALEAGYQLLGQRLAGLRPEQAAADAAVLFHGEGEGQ
jgi:hypothetical protein